MPTIYDIDLSSFVIVNETYPEQRIDCRYFRTDYDKVLFSMETSHEIESIYSGEKVKFYLSIYMDEIFGTEDFIFENGKAYLKSFKASNNYEFECFNPETPDRVLSEIYEYIDSKFAGQTAESTYTLTANLKQN